MPRDSSKSLVHSTSGVQSPSPSSRISSISPISQPRSPWSATLFLPCHDDSLSKLYTNNGPDNDDLVRKRARQTSNSPEWECHPTYDIMLHSSGCGVCHSYMTHLADSEQQPSYRNAARVRDRLRDAYFFDGVSEGRRRQRDDDEYIYQDRDRYRTERNAALEAISQYRIESHDSREELRMVTEYLRASQADCDRLRQRVDTLNKENFELANQLQARQNDPVPSTPKPEPPSPAVVMNETPSLPEPEPPRVPTSYAAVASSTSPTAFTTSVNGQRVVHLPARPSYTQVGTTASPVQFNAPYNPKTTRQLQALMTAAHEPGNDAALARVKVLCSEAHSTPRGQKTELQKVLLSEWRNPPAPPSISTPAPPPRTSARPGNQPLPTKINPRTDDPVEVWYEYLCAHQASWPRGVRRDARNRPFLADLKASRAVARMRPEINPSGNIANRAEYMACVAELFTKPGAYKERIETNEFKIASSIAFRPYRGPTPVAAEHIVTHFVDCGVTVKMASRELEPWARSYQDSAPM